MDTWDLLGGGDISKWKRDPNKKICCINGSWEKINYEPIDLYIAGDRDALLRYPNSIKKIKEQTNIEYILAKPNKVPREQNAMLESLKVDFKPVGLIRAWGPICLLHLIQRKAKVVHIYGMNGYTEEKMFYKRINSSYTSTRKATPQKNESTNENIIRHIKDIIENFNELSLVWHISNNSSPVPTELMKLNLPRIIFLC
jgi:hypothetical protein